MLGIFCESLEAFWSKHANQNTVNTFLYGLGVYQYSAYLSSSALCIDNLSAHINAIFIDTFRDALWIK